MQRHIPFLRRASLWLHRLPYRRGYGIHSPWAFNLVTGVIYEKGEYYSYEPLRCRRTSDATCEKDDRLMLRLANAFQPSRTVVWGGDAAAEPLRYMQAGRKACDYRHIESGNAEALRQTLEDWGSIDMLYVDDAEAWRSVAEECLPYVHAHTCIIIRNIGGRAREDWNALIADGRIRLSFDLYYLGILCFDGRFAKQDYVINYT